MFWVNARYAKVWKVFAAKDKYVDLSVGTSEKKQDGSYANSRWPARCIGKAYNQVKNGKVKEGEQYAILSGKLSNEHYKGEDGEWHDALRLLILEFAPAGTANENAQSEPAPTASKAPPPRSDAKRPAKPAKPAPADDEEDPW